MTTIVDRPDYEDKLPVANKITFAPHTKRQVTILLEDHVGKLGRKKDGEIIKFMMGLNDDDLDEMTLITKLTDDEEFIAIFRALTDLDDDQGEQVLEKLTVFDMVPAFRKAMDYRTAALRAEVQREDVQEAEKKLNVAEPLPLMEALAPSMISPPSTMSD